MTQDIPIIEFRDDENYCRYNGILMDRDGCLKVFGYPEELDMLDECTIKIDDKIYSNHDITELIKLLSEETVDKTPDEENYYFNEKIYVMDDFEINYFKGVRQILYFEQFKSDYPNISVDEYLAMENAIQRYYDNERLV